MIDDPFGKPCLHLTSTDGEITQALQWDGGRFTLATTIAHDLIRPSTLEVTHFRGPDNIVYEGPHAPCHRSILFNPTEFFVVQTRPHTSQAHAEWQDLGTCDEDAPAFDQAGCLRDSGDINARLVCRWR